MVQVKGLTEKGFLKKITNLSPASLLSRSHSRALMRRVNALYRLTLKVNCIINITPAMREEAVLYVWDSRTRNFPDSMNVEIVQRNRHAVVKVIAGGFGMFLDINTVGWLIYIATFSRAYIYDAAYNMTSCLQEFRCGHCYMIRGSVGADEEATNSRSGCVLLFMRCCPDLLVIRIRYLRWGSEIVENFMTTIVIEDPEEYEGPILCWDIRSRVTIGIPWVLDDWECSSSRARNWWILGEALI